MKYFQGHSWLHILNFKCLIHPSYNASHIFHVFSKMFHEEKCKYRSINFMKFSSTSGNQLAVRAHVDQTKQRKLNFEYWNPQ